MPGWERILIPRCGALVDAYAKGFPVSMTVPKVESLIWTTSGEKQSSDNHEAMAWAGELARAAAWGTAKEYELARAVVLWWIDQELRVVGLWRHEQGTSTPHGGMHLDALVTARCAFDHQADREGLAASDRHWSATAEFLEHGATLGGSVILPGDRDPNGPIAEQATAFLRELVGLPHRGPLAPASRLVKKGWPGDFWVCVRGLQALRAHHAVPKPPLVGGGPLPLLRRPMRLTEGDGWHFAELAPPPPDGSLHDVCDWVLVDHAKHDGAIIRSATGAKWSLEWAIPAPELPAGDHRVATSPRWEA